MPQAVAGAIMSGIGAWSAGYTTAGIIGSMVVSFAAGAINYKMQQDALDAARQNARDSQGRTTTVRESANPRAVAFGEVRKGGTYAFIHTTGNNNKVLHMVIALADHQVESIDEIYFDDELAFDASGNPTSQYSGHAQVTKRLGSDDQSAIPISEAGSLWGDDHRLRGVAHIYIRCEFEQTVFPNGVPNVSVQMKGANQVYDPRTDSTGYSTNSALCLAHYLTNDRWGVGADWSDIDEAALIEAANACDEDVSLSGGGTEKRYSCDGMFTEDEEPVNIIPELVSSMAGAATSIAGYWILHAGTYRQPDVTFTPDDFSGGIKLQTRTSRRDNYNAVSGTYISPENEWEPSDFPEYASDFYQNEDGRKITEDIDLPYTISAARAQRIAKIQLEKARREQVLEAPLMLSGLLTRAGDTVAIDYPRWGFDGKPFDVRELAFADDEEAMGVNLVLRETSPLVYDWDASEEQIIEAAPPTTLPGARDVPTPNVPSVSEDLYITRRSAGVRVMAVLDWGGSETAFVDRFQIEYQPDGGSWNRVPGTEATRLEIRDIEPGTYKFRVRAINRLGAVSPWAETTSINIVGTSAPPSAITGLTITSLGGMAILRWDQHPDLDVLVGGSIQFRHARQFENATWPNSVSIGERLPGSTTEAVLPLKPGTYLAKARDAEGQPANAATMVVTRAGEVLSFANVDEIQEHTAWAGTKTNVEEDAGTLVLVEGETSGNYEFAAGFDFGQVRKFRLRTELDVSVINLASTIDERETNIDTWADFDNTSDAETSIQVWVRTTNDDPNNSPTWTDWERIDSAEYEARACEFEARFSTESVDFLPVLNECFVRADEVTN